MTRGASRSGQTGQARRRCLTVASVVGGLSALWFVCSLTLGWTIVLFATGSMAPTYPTGAAAISVPVAAADIAVDDVVTVPKPGSDLPVTHRVVEVTDVPGDAEARQLVLRGDDNTTADREPYVVRDAQRVVIGFPLVGYVMTTLAQPAALLATTLVVALATVWMLWPSPDETADVPATVPAR